MIDIGDNDCVGVVELHSVSALPSLWDPDSVQFPYSITFTTLTKKVTLPKFTSIFHILFSILRLIVCQLHINQLGFFSITHSQPCQMVMKVNVELILITQFFC